MGGGHCRHAAVRASQQAAPKETEPVMVLVQVSILGISAVDQTNQEFNAEFQIDQTWHDPEFCNWMREEGKEQFDQKDWQKQMFASA